MKKKGIRLALAAVVAMAIMATGLLPGSAAAEELPRLGLNDDAGKVWTVDGKNRVAWGIDLDSYAARDNDTAFLEQQLDASVYINANFVSIPVPWKLIEPTQNNYTFAIVDDYIAMAEERGLKVFLLWLGSNYASGDSSYVPDYIMNDNATYSWVQGAAFRPNNGLLSVCDPDTLSREKAAYAQLFSHIGTNNAAGTVMAIGATGEIDYYGALPVADRDPPELDVRDENPLCDALYQNEGNVPFMEQRYALYAKGLIDQGALAYDIPTYTQVAAWSWWPGWRYAENPAVLKSTINRNNHISVPSIANPDTLGGYIDDMDRFLPANIPGNSIFTDGIDAAAHRTGRVESAPWINTLWYGGLGAMYWDSGNANLSTSIINDTLLRNKFRKYFGPLKGMEYQIARLKNSSLLKFWWKPGDTATNGTTSHFSISQTNGGNEYGVVFELGTNDIAFAGSTYGGSYTVTVTRPGGFAGYIFEKGYFDPDTGAWNRYGGVTPTISGNIATLTVSADSGDYTQVVYRFHSTDLDGAYYLVRNRWTGEYLHINSLNGKVETGRLGNQNWWSAQWYIEDAGSGYVRLRNRWQPTYYMHNWSLLGHVEYGTTTSTNWSAQWQLEDYVGNTRIRNRWTGDYIHNNSQFGYAEYGPLGSPDWWSAQWMLEEVH